MTDDDFKDDDNFEDEFDFVEEQDNKANSSSTPPSGKEPNPKRMGIIALVVIVVLVGGYFYFSGGDEASKASGDTAAPTAAAPAAPLPEPMATDTKQTGVDDMAIDFADSLNRGAAQPTDVVPAKPGAIPGKNGKSFEQIQKSLQAEAQIPAEINATLDSISEEMTLNVQQIKQLETLITNMANSIDQLNRTLSAMDNRVLSLTETVDALSQDLTNVKRIIIEEDLDLTGAATVKFSNQKPSKPISSSSTTYTVHAIIPGRAWLKSSTGQIITVREGDKVGDFGTVAVIDSANGLVRTSSGITFK